MGRLGDAPLPFQARCFLKYDAAIFKQRRVNLAVEGGMGANGNDKTRLEEDICIHIFTVSSAMVGVCLTVIGVIRVCYYTRQGRYPGGRLPRKRRSVVSYVISPFLRGPAGPQLSAEASN
jgi:hypothetical protein